MKLALDASVPSVQSEDLRRWLLLEDDVLFRQATITLGVEGLKELASEYLAKEDAGFEAAKTKLALANLSFGDIKVAIALLQEAVALLEQSGVPTRVEQQLQWQVLNGIAWYLSLGADATEQARIKALMEEAGKNPALRKDPFATLMAEYLNTAAFMNGTFPFAFNGGRRITNDDLCQSLTYNFEVCLPLLRQACDQSVGARREWLDVHRCVICVMCMAYPICKLFAFLLPMSSHLYFSCLYYLLLVAETHSDHSTQKNAQKLHAVTSMEWGESSEDFVKMIRSFTFDRFYVIGKGSAVLMSMLFPLQPSYMAEKHGNLEHLIDTFKSQQQWSDAFVRAVEPFSADTSLDVSGLNNQITSQTERSSRSNAFLFLSSLPSHH
jgi:hypothetical protein